MSSECSSSSSDENEKKVNVQELVPATGWHSDSARASTQNSVTEDDGTISIANRTEDEEGHKLEFDFSTGTYRISSRGVDSSNLGGRVNRRRETVATESESGDFDHPSESQRVVNRVASENWFENSGIGEEAPCCVWCCSTPEDFDDYDSIQNPSNDGEIRVKTGGCCRSIRAKFLKLWIMMFHESSWVLLCTLGILCSVLAWCIDEAVAILLNSKAKLANAAQSSVVSYILWSVFTTILSLSAVLVTKMISPLAAGSGIPQMRSMLAGFAIPGYLSLRTLASKVVGLLLALGSGMVIGKEGPFVHISCIIANQMLRIPIFREIQSSPALRKQTLAAACAVGVSSTFGAPIGGVLFSIEVTSSLYQTSDYWKAFFCVVCGAFAFKELSFFGQSRNNVVSLFTTDFTPLPYKFIEIPLFLILSALCGYISGFFVILHKVVSDIRHDPSSPRYITNVYSFTTLVALITTGANYPLGDFMQFSLHDAIGDLLTNDEITHAPNSPHWDNPTLFINLLLFAAIKFLLSVLAINLPVPCGVFTPVFAVGAALGRFFGELVFLMGGRTVTAGGYALVGAASFTAGATGTVSTAVIVFELTNQLSYMLPVLLSVLIGQAAARQISVSIYESLAETKNLPSFPHVRRQSSYSLPIYKIMKKRTACVPRVVTKAGIEQALLRADNFKLDPYYLFALVDNLQEKHYLGSVSWKRMHMLLQATDIWAEEVEIDMVEHCALDKSTIGINYSTSLNDAINYFDVHKQMSFFVLKQARVIGKLYLTDITALCENGQL
uniref:Chloride channel protein n=1 Tax=Mucochytrium quahogii TaxID=96639 RepID=A0A7S2RGL4_9STRA|mmetsp:Transcript_26792/g.43093  ORF Transcript_26792/g.43093 Transcript_26792/m.43093 type:complete len:782 (-) Transcript_26792:236-2581(-)|eukprot:CAMPEP_0203755240 /NCGR_PEP_ID=MMETSP0098-20131031/8715_1 /ASSEMBLY_ACC=CAM_ASM_000208 /TAXON_ID=96639 /ORGANISM=" , Strain NY0313808BC1" /LENGTH=781 /DNA_ID=CAMNT_0050646605 /DNA_START=320 /DNA_END=2665 /DNA_ORIENTATION=+